MSTAHEEYWTMDTYSPETKKANCAHGVPFIYSPEADEQTAMRKLKKGNSFILWRYLVKQKDGDSFFASGDKIREYTGLTESEYRTAKQGLRDAGYLVWTDKNRWTFHARPQTPRIKPTKTQQAAQEKRTAEVESMIADYASHISGGYSSQSPQTQPDNRRRVSNFDYDGEPFDF